MRRALWISLAVLAAAAVAVVVFLWAPWSPVQGGQLRADIDEYRGATYVSPPLPQSGALLDPLTAAEPANVPSAEQVAAAWEPMQQAATEGKWQAWGYVVDADTGEVLLDRDAGTPHTPASTAKLLSAGAALDVLDLDQRLQTGTKLEGKVLYLWGEGDLMVSATEGDSEQVVGRAGLADLAADTAKTLKEQGITTVELVYQNTLFEGEKRHPAWAAQEVQDYAGDTAPYAINTGRTAPGEWAFVEDSSRTVADAFAARLGEQGVTVASVSPGAPSASATRVATVESASIYEQLTYMLVHSDNTLAEQYCKLAAAAVGAATTFQGATAAVIAHAQQVGVDTSGLVMDDCSGLSVNNRISGKQLVGILQSNNELVRMLPRSGLNGTLDNRLYSDQTLGNVQGKTGSLGVVSSIAGVVTSSSGRNLLFAVGTDQVPEQGAYWTRAEIDQFLEAIAAI